MVKIVHISDLHIGRGGKEIDNLNTICNYLLKRFENENLNVIITGDTVDDGQEGQFTEAAKLINMLLENKKFNVWLSPGNHDYGWNGIHAERQRFKYFKKAYYELENVTYPHIKIDQFGHAYIGLNSMKAECDFWDGLLADGELGSHQIHSLSGILKHFDALPPYKREKYKVIVHLHHHPFLYPDTRRFEETYERGCHWLKDGAGLMKVLAGRVDILLFGHEHRHLDFSQTNICPRYRIPYIFSCGKSTENGVQYELDQQGIATNTVLNQGLLGWMIDIDDAGNVRADTIVFG